MTDMLSKLYAAKAVVRASDEVREPLDVLRARAEGRRPERRGFRAALAVANGPAIVAEIKRASPSVGLIVPHLDPAAIAREYEQAGADAISVLTESDHFLGDLAYVDVARSASSLPILRKDFLSSSYEVVQSAAYGADAMVSWTSLPASLALAMSFSAVSKRSSVASSGRPRCLTRSAQ